MKPSLYRRIRRRTATEAATNKKENKQESSFFGEAATEHFFQPATVITQPTVINRKCAECEQEDKKVQRAEDKKEEDKKLQRMTEKKEEEKLQRQPEKKEEEKLMKKGDEKEEEKIQKKETGNPASTPVTSSYISSLNSKGTPLPKQSQQFFGSRMGYDFSHVKVHTDQEAAQSANEVNAKAYTTGEHIVFNEGQYDTNSAEGKKLMAHELAHVVQVEQNGSGQLIKRQVAPAEPAPHFRDCVQTVTGVENADAELLTAMNNARTFVATAIELLANAPEPGTTYETALALHFGSPLADSSRARLRSVFQRILSNLVVENFICNRTACPSERTQAMWHPSDDLLHICRPFWAMNETCQAVILIHEAAHDAGIDLDDPATPAVEPHTPNRGERAYPVAGGRRRRASRSQRANTPDAYAFFAAHVHNSVDTPGNCFS